VFSTVTKGSYPELRGVVLEILVRRIRDDVLPKVGKPSAQRVTW
jgi:hypothetical protein